MLHGRYLAIDTVQQKVIVMTLYQKNTELKLKIRGDGEELFEYSLPHPASYERHGDYYIVSYIIKGYFHTNKSQAYLNDIIARFMLSMDILSTDVSITTQKDKAIDLKLFQGLKSIVRPKHFEKVDCGRDNVFWSIKLYTEQLIKEHGEGNLIPHSILERYAFDNFIDRTKDKSTLKAKVRSIWNWYNDKGWIIPTRKRKLTDEELKLTRQEAGKKAHKKLAEKTKAKVLKAIAGLEFMHEKVNIANVSRDAGVSRNTAKKYLIELGYK